MRSYGIPEKIINIMRSIYRRTSCCVKVDGKCTEWFDIMTGVRQWCLLSPIIFAVIIDWVMRNSVDQRDEGMMWKKRPTGKQVLEQRRPGSIAGDTDLKAVEHVTYLGSNFSSKGDLQV